MLHCYCYIKHKTRTASQPTNQTGPACARCAVHMCVQRKEESGQGIGRKPPGSLHAFLAPVECSCPD